MIETLTVRPWEGGVGAFAHVGAQLEDAVIAPADGALQPGAIHRARVVQRRGGLAFAATVAGEVAFEAGADGPRQGELATLQVAAAARDGKPARATRRIALEGALLVLIPGGGHASTSRRVVGAEARRELATRARRATPDGFGAIARSAAADATDEALAAEAASLVVAWRRLDADSGSSPALLRQDPAAVRAVRPFLALAPRRILCAAEAMTAAIAAALPGIADRVATDTLDDADAIAEALTGATSPSIALGEGAALRLERTAALAAVDVDSGTLDAGEANLRAARVLPRLLRLNEIVGPVLVDFIRAPAGARAGLERALARGLALDRRDVAILGWTRGGLLELARAGDVVD